MPEKGFSWRLQADPNWQLPASAPAVGQTCCSKSPTCHMPSYQQHPVPWSCWNSCGELALAGSQAPTQLPPLPQAGQERKQEEKEQENSWVEI